LGQKASANVVRTAQAATPVHRAPRPAGLSALPARPASILPTGLASAPGLLCTAAFDGHFQQLSPAWAKTLGWSTRQLTSRPFIAFVHPGDRLPLRAQLATLARGAAPVQFEHRWLCRDGRTVWLQWRASRLPARGDQFQAVAHDVSELRQLRRQVLDAADQEREHLGRELHDGLCQNLAGIAALGSALSRRLAASGASDCAGALTEIATLLNQTVVHVRDLAHGLCPAALQAGGIADALQALADNVQHLFGVACVFDCRQACPALAPDTALHLYRIAQQAVHNALTHARGSRIDITLGQADGQGFVSIGDDGAGMPAQPSVPRSLGLQSMAYRAQLIGGALAMRQQRPTGTLVTCAFQWPAPQHGAHVAQGDGGAA
jgi:PAS domain S-box-containing protein